MENKIYDFLKGETATWLEDKILKKLKDSSVFSFLPISIQNWENIRIVNNNFVYADSMNQYYLFAYKKQYATRHWRDFPKFHNTNCRTREEFSNFHFTNSMPVDIYCTDQHKILSEQFLKYCKNCNREINFFSFGRRNKTWYDVIIDIADKRSKENSYDSDSIRADGYSKDWSQVSYAVRGKEGFRCRNCSILLSDSNAFFLEVHHIDKNRLNNKKDNLVPLCVECHSNVDDSHRRNYSAGENFQKLLGFRNRFRI